MKSELQEKKNPDVDLEEDELVPEDDRVIGRALRWSLVALVAIVAIVVGVLWFLGRPEPTGPEQAIAAEAPRVTETVADPPEVRFTDVTAASGIDFVHFNGAYGEKLLPESMGGGAAFFDFDNDGHQDLLLVNGSNWPERPAPGSRPTLKLYRNDGKGRFQDVTAGAGLGVSLYGMGAAVGDYDNDGNVDVFVTAVGRNRLFRNLGGRFEDVTDRSGLAPDPTAWSTCSTFVDVDNDGDLDLFACNYVKWSRDIDFKVDYRLTGIGRAYGPPTNYEGTYSRLYRNEGDGRFTDVSKSSGIQVDNPDTGFPMGKALGVAPVDVDGDGWMDLIVANDTAAKFFFRNQGDGTFAEEGTGSGLAYDRMGNATGAMGIDAGRYRNDAELGVLVGNFANEMTSVYVSQGEPTLFADEAITEGIGAPSRLMLTFGLFLFDYDLDGRLDMLQANGHLEDEINQVDPSQQYRQPAQLFWNAGPDARQTFVPVPEETTGDLARPLVGRGSAYADVDGDGDLDAIITQVGDKPLLLRNDQSTGHHWLRVKLVGKTANRDAIGAWVEMTAGGVTQRRQVMPTKSYLSQSELPVTFGLGTADRVESLKVIWPGGQEQTVANVGVDRLITVEQGAAQ